MSQPPALTSVPMSPSSAALSSSKKVQATSAPTPHSLSKFYRHPPPPTNRGLKFQLYRQIPSLNDYLLVHCDDVLIEHYSRQPNEGWLLHEYRGPGARIPLTNLDCELHLGAVYDGVMDEPG